MHKSFCYTKMGWSPRIPAIKEKIAKSDPEVAAIAIYRLNYQYYLSRDDNQLIKKLSENLQKFPHNQYFQYEFALNTLRYSHDGELDPAILYKLSNRLIAMDANNSNYHYLKAFALLLDRNGNNFDEIIKETKQAGRCKEHNEPYLIYQDRVLSLAQKQGLHSSLIKELNHSHPDNFYIRDVYNILIMYQNLLITERDFAKTDEISNLLKGMLKDYLCFPHLNRGQLYGLGGGFGYWNLPQEVELQRKNLSRHEADQKRLEICAIAAAEKKIKPVYNDYRPNENTELYAIAVLPFMFLVRLTTVFISITAILLIISVFRKNKFETTNRGLIRFLIYGLVYFIAGQFFIILELLDPPMCHCCHYNYKDIFLFPPITFAFKYLDWEEIIYFLKGPYFIFPFALPIGIVFCMAIIKFFKPKFDNSITRFICGIMISIPLGIITMILQGHTYFKYLPIIIFALFAIKYSFRKITFRNIFKAFGGSCENEIPALRTDLFKLSVIATVLCWLGLLLLTYPVKKSMAREEREVKYYTYSPEEDYEKAYQEILKKIDDVNLSEQAVPTYISLVKSKDLPEVMEKIKKRKFLPLWMTESHQSNPPPVSNKYRILADTLISSSLRFAGKDQVPVIISYMDNPDNNRTLVARARLGDRKVKDKLTIALNEAIKAESEPNEIEERYNPEKPRVSELISALAAISRPDEAIALVKGYFDTHPIEQIDMYFNYKGFCVLPKTTVLKILNLYLDKAENEIRNSVSYRKYNSLYPLRNLDGLYWDSETATKTLSLILLASDKEDRHLETFGIEYYLTPDATDMLIKGLQSDNENLRAWCVWQLRKINYKWNEAELKKISEDKSWKVRANLAVIDKSLIKEDETSDYVKLIKSM